MPFRSKLEYKFHVAKFDSYKVDEIYASRKLSVIRRNVLVTFNLEVYPNDSREDYSQYLGVYVNYKDGPKTSVAVDCVLSVETDNGTTVLGDSKNQQWNREVSMGIPKKLPRGLDKLISGGHLTASNTLLHITADISIPFDAFEDPDGSYHVYYDPQAPVMMDDPLRQSLFEETSITVPTDSPLAQQIQLEASDGGSFWVDKKILGFASGVFKDLFDQNKPLEAQPDCFKNGVFSIDMNKDALYHLVHFIYLGVTPRGFSQFASHILPVADEFQFNALKRVCEQSLLAQMNNLSPEDLLSCLQQSDTFGMSQLTTATKAKLTEKLGSDDSINDGKFLTKMIEYAHKHGHAALKHACETKLVATLQLSIDSERFLSLLSLARKCDLVDLSTWCTKWMGKNYDVIKEDLTRLMNEKGEDGQGMIHFLIQIFSGMCVQNDL